MVRAAPAAPPCAAVTGSAPSRSAVTRPDSASAGPASAASSATGASPATGACRALGLDILAVYVSGNTPLTFYFVSQFHSNIIIWENAML